MRFSFLILTLAFSLSFALPSFGVWGVLDEVPGATVVLPFFEVGIDATQNPQDTLPVIYNRGSNPVIVHWEAYDIDGNAILSGTETIIDAGSWSFSMRSLIDLNASALDRAALTDGDFYRGFMTIDAVTVGTFLPPFDANYPFRASNILLGYAYYARLAQGSANGLTLPTLEYTAASSVPLRIRGFYAGDDRLEEMDIFARTCAQELIEGDGCSNTDQTATIRSRVFQSSQINGRTRVIVFAWDTTRPDQGGPSAICAVLGDCATDYNYQRFRENAEVADSGTLRLDHVVNIIETDEGDIAPGEFVIRNVEDPSGDLQLFAFSFNSAQPANNPNTNWDAIFVSSILP